MIECLKRIIHEYQKLEPRRGLLPRRVAIGSLPGKVSVVTGVKGSSKTSLLHQRIRRSYTTRPKQAGRWILWRCCRQRRDKNEPFY